MRNKGGQSVISLPASKPNAQWTRPKLIGTLILPSIGLAGIESHSELPVPKLVDGGGDATP